jgi:hypothetical protein
MAKVTARGATKIAEAWKNEGNTRTTCVLRSDGAILRKWTWFMPDGRIDHSTGFVVIGREMPLGNAPAWVRRMEGRGYQTRYFSTGGEQ